MPQLDLFTIQAQLICLIISIFFIYNFLLKYALSSFDAYSRLKLKKLNFFKTQNVLLSYFSIYLKKKTLEYSYFIFENFFDISKLYNTKLTLTFKQWYKTNLISKYILKKINKKSKKRSRRIKNFRSRINVIIIRYNIIKKLEDKIKDIIIYYTKKEEKTKEDKIIYSAKKKKYVRYIKIIEKLKKKINFRNIKLIRKYIKITIFLNKNQSKIIGVVFDKILNKINKHK
jgi:hypothetical protein